MSKCQQCGADLPPRTEGKRKRKFCDNNNKCKQSYYYKNKPKDYVRVPVEELKELGGYRFKSGVFTLVGNDAEIVRDMIPNIDKKEMDKILDDLFHLGMAATVTDGVKTERVNPLSDEVQDAIKNNEESVTPVPPAEKYPSDFNGLLKFAKEGKVENKEEFKAWVNAQRLTGNQKSMILSKI